MASGGTNEFLHNGPTCLSNVAWYAFWYSAHGRHLVFSVGAICIRCSRHMLHNAMLCLPRPVAQLPNHQCFSLRRRERPCTGNISIFHTLGSIARVQYIQYSWATVHVCRTCDSLTLVCWNLIPVWNFISLLRSPTLLCTWSSTPFILEPLKSTQEFHPIPM